MPKREHIYVAKARATKKCLRHSPFLQYAHLHLITLPPKSSEADTFGNTDTDAIPDRFAHDHNAIVSRETLWNQQFVRE